MYIIISGGGTAGCSMVRALVDNHDVVVIDKDKQMCEEIYSNYGAVSVHGNATTLSVLKDAGIDRCDVAVGLLKEDADNLAFTVLAADSGVDKILVRMRDPEYESAFFKAGATTVGGVIEMMVERFVIDIEEPRIRRVASLGDGRAEISIITAPQGSYCASRTVAEIASHPNFPDDVIIAGIYDPEADKLIIPRGDRTIAPGTQVFLVATEKDMRRAADCMMKDTR